MVSDIFDTILTSRHLRLYFWVSPSFAYTGFLGKVRLTLNEAIAKLSVTSLYKTLLKHQLSRNYRIVKRVSCWLFDCFKIWYLLHMIICIILQNWTFIR